MPEVQPHSFNVLEGFECEHCGLTPDEVEDEGYCPEGEPMTVEVE